MIHLLPRRQRTRSPGTRRVSGTSVDLADPLLEDVSRAIFTSSTNRLLRALEDLDAFPPRDVDLRRIRYENRSLLALRAKPGDALELIRDYDDNVDRDAIAVSLMGQQIGYLPRPTAQILAPEMDTGSGFSATVTGIERTRIPKGRVRASRD